MTRNKFTSEEDNLIVDRIRKNPYNLQARFREDIISNSRQYALYLLELTLIWLIEK